MSTPYDYVIVGGGMAADAAVAGIRELDGDGSILVVGREGDAPYGRPALSKKLWTDPEMTQESIALGTASEHADLRTGVEVVGIDAPGRTVTTDDGESYRYGALLLATGGVPALPDGVTPSERVLTLRTLDDYRSIRAAADAGRRVAVVGGGYIGMELAASIRVAGGASVLVHPGERVGDTMFPEPFVEHLERTYRERGVELRPGSRVAGVEEGDGVRLLLEDGDRVDADLVVFGLGVSPDVALAHTAGIEVSDGVVVDERLRSSDERIFAAGDIASYVDPLLGRTRVEHKDNALTQGLAAGRSMAGDTAPYDYTPYFYSVLFDDGYEAVGTVDPSLDALVDGDPSGRAVAYLRSDDGSVAGVLLWNVEAEGHDPKDTARRILAESRVRSDDQLLGAI